MNPLHLRRYGSRQLLSETSQQLCRGAGSLKGDSTAHLTVTLPSPKELGAQEDGRTKRKAFRLNRDHQHLSTTKGHLCWSTSQHFLSTVSGQQSAGPPPLGGHHRDAAPPPTTTNSSVLGPVLATLVITCAFWAPDARDFM